MPKFIKLTLIGAISLATLSAAFASNEELGEKEILARANKAALAKAERYSAIEDEVRKFKDRTKLLSDLGSSEKFEFPLKRKNSVEDLAALLDVNKQVLASIQDATAREELKTGVAALPLTSKEPVSLTSPFANNGVGSLTLGATNCGDKKNNEDSSTPGNAALPIISEPEQKEFKKPESTSKPDETLEEPKKPQAAVPSAPIITPQPKQVTASREKDGNHYPVTYTHFPGEEKVFWINPKDQQLVCVLELKRLEKLSANTDYSAYSKSNLEAAVAVQGNVNQYKVETAFKNPKHVIKALKKKKK